MARHRMQRAGKSGRGQERTTAMAGELSQGKRRAGHRTATGGGDPRGTTARDEAIDCGSYEDSI